VDAGRRPGAVGYVGRLARSRRLLRRHDSDTDRDPAAVADSDIEADTHADGDANTDAYREGDSNLKADANRNTDRSAHADADTGSDRRQSGMAGRANLCPRKSGELPGPQLRVHHSAHGVSGHQLEPGIHADVVAGAVGIAGRC
jgi:hypothetical protein